MIDEDDDARLAAVQVAGVGHGDRPDVLLESGVAPHHAKIDRATRWLLDREIRRPGDWCETVAGEPGGWCFEYQQRLLSRRRRHGDGR